MPFQEVVETEGHLIDSHIMESVFDKVVECHGRFEVEQFRIGRTNSEPSYLRLKVETADAPSLDRLLSSLLELGCTPVDSADAVLREVERDRCAPEDFYSTTNHRTYVRLGQEWVEVQNQRMDAMIVVDGAQASCCRLRDVRRGDRIVVGLRGIRVAPEGKERDRMAFAFMSQGISSERQVDTAVRQTAALVRAAIESHFRVVVVAGPVVVHTGGAGPLAALIRNGWVQAVLSGNALGVHDIESALFGTSLGIRLSDGRQEEHGHRNLPRRQRRAGRGRRPAALRHPLRMRARAGSLRAGRKPAGRRPAARNHHRHERRAGRLRPAAQGRRTGPVPGFHAAFHRYRQHAAGLG
jgi:lysine-ketoglutarate reductase/saccharopine dehydrogenase-like protein (TIGR00300 family)